jgi:hypothetical protein
MNAALRATFQPCSASGIAQPKITSSTCSAFNPGTRSTAATSNAAARSSGRVFFSVPLFARPTALRTALATITFIGNVIWILFSCELQSWRASVAQRLARREHGLDALVGLGFAAQLQERFALQLEVVLLVQLSARSDRALNSGGRGGR